MKTKLSRLVFCVVLVGMMSAWTLAQDSDANNSKGEVRNITGCLTKSGGGNEYLLTATDGSTWEIHGNNAVRPRRSRRPDSRGQRRGLT